jgi:hypothetical protein
MIVTWCALCRAITVPREHSLQRFQQQARIAQGLQMLIDESRRELRAAGIAQSNNWNRAVQALECPGKLKALIAIDGVAKNNGVHH